MAWGEPSCLKFDLEEISRMRKKIQSTATELNAFKTNLLNSLNELKQGWDTPAGRKFTSEVNTDWAVQVDKYITIIDAVDQLLKVTEDNYQDVINEINKITF